MKILVTGGLGFIGSHTVAELAKNHHEIVIIDNLANSKLSTLDNIEKIIGYRPKFYQMDLLNYESLREIFSENQFDCVMHFAGLKAVSESIQLPIEYYENNLCSTLNILKCMKEFGVFNIIFSSSACVYGFTTENPIDETSPSMCATNPYGRTKSFIEEILKDLFISDNRYTVTILRYFNPVGAHPSGLIGEDPNGIPSNLMPIMLKVASGESPILHIFGKDYNTKDGTAVRDFIHVVDLARGHVCALENVKSSGIHVYNLGTGQGTTVLELVEAFNEVNGNLIKYDFCERRNGDVDVNFAKTDKVFKELGWKAEYNIKDMCRDAWNYKKLHNEE